MHPSEPKPVREHVPPSLPLKRWSNAILLFRALFPSTPACHPFAHSIRLQRGETGTDSAQLRGLPDSLVHRRIRSVLAPPRLPTSIIPPRPAPPDTHAHAHSFISFKDIHLLVPPHTPP